MLRPSPLKSLALAAALGLGVAGGADAATKPVSTTEFISDKEPDLSARLKAVEAQTQAMSGPMKKLKDLDGISAGMTLSMVAQSPLNAGLGDTDQTVFAQFRLGQGSGLTGLPSSYSKPNATAFQLGGLDAAHSVALLALAWYQASMPLPLGGFKPESKQTLELTLGKMDPFAFFDQNAVAGDETRQFLNSVFVHNPLLDAGGDVGVDANGFAPGLRLSLLDSSDQLEAWHLSLESSLQLVGQPAGVAGAQNVRVFGLRSQFTF